ncbi:MAG: acyl-CoA dehydrogenase family protein [Dehalococcoidia bacterium]|jgi:alkylation response protein AidB-like acyl-CoA dehydrogenase|nr:acyl-CoA dehydrogenase family protein [Dehalococcoidia bacterium]MDP7090202.1 acyl-CoA dehydrogenase family protein [Dehalococcoidia bacterium]
MTTEQMLELRTQLLSAVRDFVRREAAPQAAEHDENDSYPAKLVDQMAEMGLFGMTVPEEYGGLGVDVLTFAMVFEEISKVWMSLTGPIGSHSMLTFAINKHGSEEQKQRWLPDLATGKKRAGLALTEPGGGTDVANMRTHAVRVGEEYVINGSKQFITNGRNGDVFLLLAKTDIDADPAYRGITGFIAEKGPGFTAGKDFNKLGYRGVDTSELIFDDYRISTAEVLGEEGKGFYQAMDALETGRINVGSRAVGVAQGAFEAAIAYAQSRETFGRPIASRQTIQNMLADMGTKIHAARLMVRDAAEKKQNGDRVDEEAGMAKLYASEICAEVTMDAMRIHGGVGYVKDLPLERYYRDAPLMIIGEGTNEIQRLVIAKNLLKRYKI